MWFRGKVPVTWDDTYKKFNYKDEPIVGNQAEDWFFQGYYHDKTYGSMYGYPNDMPEWTLSVAHNLKLFRCGYVFYKMETLDIMPTHQDHFKKYSQLYCIHPSDVYRAVVFLEDWKPGHYFEIDGEGIVNWKAGEFILWRGDVPHAASNIGIDDRYTLQITGQM